MADLSGPLTTFARARIERLIRDHPNKSTLEVNNEVRYVRGRLTAADLRNLKLKHQALVEHFSDDEIDDSHERGFWIFYASLQDAAKATNSPESNDKDINFFNRVLERWKDLENKIRQSHRRQAAQNILSHPTPDMTSSLSVHNTATDNQSNNFMNQDSNHRGVTSGIELKKISKAISLDEIEERLRSQLQSLELLKGELTPLPQKERVRWLKDIKKIQELQHCPDLILAMFGDSGTGKSSVINAMLGEKLLPSNSRQACTPFSIEVGYWKDAEENARIKITTHYIEADSWVRDVKMLLDIYHGSGTLNEQAIARGDEDFKAMREKVRVLCPELARGSVTQMENGALENHKDIVPFLGQKTTSVFSEVKKAHDAIDQLIRGRHHSTSQSIGTRLPPLWPLVKLLRIEIKNDILKDGATLVDLPGTHDTNTARTAVADRQMKSCSAVWVVAPLIRAADNAGAKSFLSKAFRNKLHSDKLSLVFVGTKSDDIGRFEDEAESLDIQLEIGHLRDKFTDLQDAIIPGLQAEQEKLGNELESKEGLMWSQKHEITLHKNLKSLIETGQPQPRPEAYQSGRKRKSSASHYQPDTETIPASKDEFDDACGDLISTVEQLDEMMNIAQLEADFALTSKAAQDIVSEQKKNAQRLDGYEKELESSNFQMLQMCIHARNIANTRDVKKSFADALREHQEGALHTQGNIMMTSNMTEEEIQATADALPVFMVSAKAHEFLTRKKQHQQLSHTSKGRDGLESASLRSYTDVHDTGIPQLREHCVQQARTKRMAHAVSLLNKIQTVTTSLSLSVLGNTFDPNITSSDLERARNQVKMLVDDARPDLENIIDKSNDDYQLAVGEAAMQKRPEACESAEAKALAVTENFGGLVRTINTFKAIARRKGVFKSPLDVISYDLNDNLRSLVWDVIGIGWNHVFGDLHKITNTKLWSDCCKRMARVKEGTKKIASDLTCSPKIAKTIDEQHGRYMWELKKASKSYYQDIQFAQRDAYDLLYKSLQEQMAPCYEAIKPIKGKGALVQARTEMLRRLPAIISTMFDIATLDMVAAIDEAFTDAAAAHRETVLDDILSKMEADLMNVFRSYGNKVDPKELKFRREIIDFLDRDFQIYRAVSSDGWFAMLIQASTSKLIYLTVCSLTKIEALLFRN